MVPPILLKVKAGARLIQAARADEQMAINFLTANGFKGLKRHKDVDNKMNFHFTSFDPKHLTKYLGQPKQGATTMTWNVGKAGTLTVLTKRNIVMMINKGGAGAEMPSILPIETHVPKHIETPQQAPIPKKAPQAPVPKAPAPAPAPKPKAPDQGPTKLPPAESPNIPGAKDNDNSGVPVVPLPKALTDQYFWVQQNQGSPTHQLSFIKKLWHYFNAEKFGGKLQEPKFNLLKNQAAAKMRLRGRWWPAWKRLDIAPRLFNARENFFVEIFLHEMCHQAVTEIDKASSDPTNLAEKGHGPHWKAWMRKVGLNPLRFDPNDNTTYMTHEEKQHHEKKKQELIQKKEEVKQQIQDQGLAHIWSPAEDQLVTVNWNNQLYHGMIACANDKGRKRWAFVNGSDVYSDRYMLVPYDKIYKFNGNMEVLQPKVEAMRTKAAKIRGHIQMKADVRSDRRELRRRFGF